MKFDFNFILLEIIKVESHFFFFDKLKFYPSLKSRIELNRYKSLEFQKANFFDILTKIKK